MAHGLILSIEAKATEFAHLWEKAQISSNASSHFSRTFWNYTSWGWTRALTQSVDSTSSLEMASAPTGLHFTHTISSLDIAPPVHKISWQELWKHKKQGHRHTFSEFCKQRAVCPWSRHELKSFQNPLQVIQFWLVFLSTLEIITIINGFTQWGQNKAIELIQIILIFKCHEGKTASHQQEHTA